MPGSPIKRARKAGVSIPCQAVPTTPTAVPPDFILPEIPDDYPIRKPNESPHDFLDRIGIDRLCSLLVAGLMAREISRAVGLDKSATSLRNWILADADRVEKWEKARTQAAESWDEKALENLELANDVVAIMRAREIAAHLRWRASKLSATYSDKLDVSLTPSKEMMSLSSRLSESRKRLDFFDAEIISTNSGDDDEPMALPEPENDGNSSE